MLYSASKKIAHQIDTKIFGKDPIKSELELATIDEKLAEPVFEWLDPAFDFRYGID